MNNLTLQKNLAIKKTIMRIGEKNNNNKRRLLAQQKNKTNL